MDTDIFIKPGGLIEGHPEAKAAVRRIYGLLMIDCNV